MNKNAEYWKSVAEQAMRNVEFYQGLLDDCARHLGVEAFTADDGSIMEEPVRLKIPELVQKLVLKKRKLSPFAQRLADVMRAENLKQDLEWDGDRISVCAMRENGEKYELGSISFEFWWQKPKEAREAVERIKIGNGKR